MPLTVKERAGFASGVDDDAKFDNPWRRDRPLHDGPNSRDSSRRPFDAPVQGDRPSLSDGASDWRSSRPVARMSEPEIHPRRRGSGFPIPEGQLGAADKEPVWSMGTKFKPAPPSNLEEGSRFGSVRGRGDMGPPRDPASISDEADWRSSARPRPIARSSTSCMCLLICDALNSS